MVSRLKFGRVDFENHILRPVGTDHSKQFISLNNKVYTLMGVAPVFPPSLPPPPPPPPPPIVDPVDDDSLFIVGSGKQTVIVYSYSCDWIA